MPLIDNSEIKNILKDKLVNYHNEQSLTRQHQHFLCEAALTEETFRRPPNTPFSHHQIASAHSKKIEAQWGHSSSTLSFFTKAAQQKHHDLVTMVTLETDGFSSPRRALTRENIFAMNKAGKAKRQSLTKISAQLAARNNNKEISPSKIQINPNHIRSKSAAFDRGSEAFGSGETQLSRGLENTLTIRKSKKQKIEHPYDYMRQGASTSHSSRPRQHSQFNLKNKSAARPNTCKMTEKHDKGKPSIDGLSEFFNPHHHKETKSGYIVNQFKPRIRAKHFQDNVRVMTTLMRKKVMYLSGPEVVEYVRKIGADKKYYVPQQGIQKIVKENSQSPNRKPKIPTSK